MRRKHSSTLKRTGEDFALKLTAWKKIIEARYTLLSLTLLKHFLTFLPLDERNNHAWCCQLDARRSVKAHTISHLRERNPEIQVVEACLFRSALIKLGFKYINALHKLLFQSNIHNKILMWLNPAHLEKVDFYATITPVETPSDPVYIFTVQIVYPRSCNIVA